VASRFTTLTTHGLASSASASSPNRTTCKYVSCSLGETSSAPCSSKAASRITTLTPSLLSSLPFVSLATAGSASTTASAGPETLRFCVRLRKWKCEKRRREFRLLVGTLESRRFGTWRSPVEEGSPIAASGPVRLGAEVSCGADFLGLAYSNLPRSSRAPSSSLSVFPNPPSTTVSKIKSLDKGYAADEMGASGWSFGSRT